MCETHTHSSNDRCSRKPGNSFWAVCRERSSSFFEKPSPFLWLILLDCCFWKGSYLGPASPSTPTPRKHRAAAAVAVAQTATTTTKIPHPQLKPSWLVGRAGSNQHHFPPGLAVDWVLCCRSDWRGAVVVHPVQSPPGRHSVGGAPVLASPGVPPSRSCSALSVVLNRTEQSRAEQRSTAQPHCLPSTSSSKKADRLTALWKRSR